jgi:hypothetical protein
MDGKNYAVNRSDTLSFRNMKDVTFERPSISLPLGERPICIIASGKASVFINGEQLGKKLFELDEILILALVTGLVGFIVMLIQIFRNK